MHQDAVVRGLRTAAQAIIGAFIGLIVTVWAVPGVPDAVASYLLNNFLPVAVALGIPAGIVAYIWNIVRPR